MNGKLQHQIAFYLTGRRDESSLQAMNASYRPALFARYGDLSSLRYDFPLVLNRPGISGRALLSLSRLVDDAVETMHESPDRDRIARHGYSIEREVRRELAEKGPGDLATMWHTAAAQLAIGDETVKDSAMTLWTAFDADGDLFDADINLPSRAVKHAWSSIQAGRAKVFRERSERLLFKLRNILAAEVVGSEIGRAPERLQAGVGASFAGSFDFAAMSRILVEARPGVSLSKARRDRIEELISVLERQRFYPHERNGSEPFAFSFDRCSDALRAYQERHDDAVKLVKTLAVAELEANGEYRESVHDLLFEGFGANGLDAGELAELPDYLVCTDASTLDAAETAQLVELLAAGLPIKVLVRTDDVLEPSVVAEGHVALGLRARQMVDTAIGLTDVFVFQASASHLYGKRESLMRGLSYGGPALFSVFSGASGHTGEIPAYLVAAAAMESRVFTALVYDPSEGPDWASRLTVDDNPSPDDDWPVHVFGYEDEELQSRSEKLAFTLADFMAMDDRFFGHYAVVPQSEWSDAMIPVPEALLIETKGLPAIVPYVMLLDDDGRTHRAIIDDRTLLEVRRSLNMWHSLQELGGIHNSHATRLLDRERKEQVPTMAPLNAVDAPLLPPAASEVPIAAETPEPEPLVQDTHGDDPYIDTARCTTCNECTNLNNRMFAYNSEKQAYVADPDAGTFRQLVEAAEGCQVSIIHPGKPRNQKEPGLEDLIMRASVFN